MHISLDAINNSSRSVELMLKKYEERVFEMYLFVTHIQVTLLHHQNLMMMEILTETVVPKDPFVTSRLTVQLQGTRVVTKRSSSDKRSGE